MYVLLVLCLYFAISKNNTLASKHFSQIVVFGEPKNCNVKSLSHIKMNI